MGSKYEPLEHHLRAQSPGDPVTLTFSAIETLVGPLPPSSFQRTWWANTWGHPQSAAWLAAGRLLDNIDIAAAVVEFTPVGEVPRRYDLNLWIGHPLEGATYLPR